MELPPEVSGMHAALMGAYREGLYRIVMLASSRAGPGIPLEAYIALRLTRAGPVTQFTRIESSQMEYDEAVIHTRNLRGNLIDAAGEPVRASELLMAAARRYSRRGLPVAVVAFSEARKGERTVELWCPFRVSYYEVLDAFVWYL